MSQKRVFRPRRRLSGFRDAKLIIIATEGMRTERKYFVDLASPKYFSNPRVHVEVLKRENSASSPEHIIKILDDFRNNNRLNKYDELWLVIDVDRWGDKKLTEIAQECLQKNYLLAVSNPCFEIWLLLHIRSLEEYSQEILEEFRANRKTNNHTRLEFELANLLNGYNKSNLDTSVFLPNLEGAIVRAKRLDVNPEHRWTNNLGTRVYLLATSIISRKIEEI